EIGARVAEIDGPGLRRKASGVWGIARHYAHYAPLLQTPRGNITMGMPAASTKWTAERVRALPDDGKRYEVIDGELYVTPAPSWEHQRAALGLAYRIRSYLEGQAVAEVYLAPADIEFRFDRMVEPD